MRTALNLLSLTIWALILPTNGHAIDDFFVNSVTGTDDISCGYEADTPCKTIKKTLERFQQGEAIIKISRGSYVEEDMVLPSTPITKNDITIEGGWSADFTQQSCGPADTVIIPAPSTLPDVTFAASVFNDEIAAYTFRCTTLNRSLTGEYRRAMAMSAHGQGQIELTIEHVRVTGFSNAPFHFWALDNTTFSTDINQLTLDNNSHILINVESRDSGISNFTMKNSRLQHNGTANNWSLALSLWTQGQGTMNATLENTIIADNSNDDGSAGIAALSNGTNPFSLNITNCTISDNICETCQGAGLRVTAYSSSQPHINMNNTILWGNRSSQQHRDIFLFEQSGSHISLSANYNIIGEYEEDGTPDYTSTHELNLDPQLDTTYHLQNGSPAIDAGQCGYNYLFYTRVAPYDDIDGDDRPGFSELLGCDIGADEYVYSFPWATFLPAIISHGSQ